VAGAASTFSVFDLPVVSSNTLYANEPLSVSAYSRKVPPPSTLASNFMSSLVRPAFPTFFCAICEALSP